MLRIRSTPHQYPIRHCDGLHCTGATWDFVAQKESLTTLPDGLKTTTTYDKLQRKSRVSWSNGECVDFRYLDYGQHTQRDVVDICDSSGNDGPKNGFLTTYHFDGLHRTITESRASGVFRETIYFSTTKKSAGDTRWTAPGGVPQWTKRSRDALGNEYLTELPDGSKTQEEIRSGNLIRTDELGRIHEIDTDGWGRQAVVREFLPSTTIETTFAYDHRGRTTVTTDPKGNTYSSSWDSLGRKKTECDPSRGCSSFDYWPDGLLKNHTNSLGNTYYEYDKIGRRTLRVDDRGRTAIWTYDTPTPGAANTAARLSQTTSSDGVTETFDYDARGRLAAKSRCVQGRCATLGFGYDLSGFRRFIRYPDQSGNPGGDVVEFEPDLDGLPQAIIGFAPRVKFDPEQRLSEVVFNNNTKQSWTYDPMRGWNSETAISDGAGNSVLQLTTTHNAAGEIATRRTTAFSVQQDSIFTHDPLGRLESEMDISGVTRDAWAYDELGNVRLANLHGKLTFTDPSKPYCVSDISSSQVPFRHDALGNIEESPFGLYEWNLDETLASSTSKVGRTTYLYTADGDRAGKQSPLGTTLFFFPEVESRNGVFFDIVRYKDTLIAEHSNGAPTTYFHVDELESVRLATSGTGAVVGVAEYSAFGEAFSTLPSSFGYLGLTSDAETGLVYANARYLDPRIGRFVSPDSVTPVPGDWQSFNLYAYGRNSPYQFTDRSGRTPLSLGVRSTAAEFVVSNGLFDPRASTISMSPLLKPWHQSLMSTNELYQRQISDIARSRFPASFYWSAKTSGPDWGQTRFEPTKSGIYTTIYYNNFRESANGGLINTTTSNRAATRVAETGSGRG